MSVREYVGARYVPIVVGEWDNTRTYEPLMVVSHQGNSYTSRQYVPTGIDIANESYWVLSANYNAQVEAYRQEVQAFDGRINANAQRIAENAQAINAEKTRAEGAEQTLQSSVSANTRDIQTIRDESVQHMVIIGDSYSSQQYLPSGTLWCSIVASRMNMTLHNYADPGAGYIHVGDQHKGNFAAEIDRAANDTSFDNSKVGIAILVGGVNDFIFSASQITSGLNYIVKYVIPTINKLTSTFPNAKVFVGVDSFSTFNTIGTDHESVFGLQRYLQYRKSRFTNPGQTPAYDTGAILSSYVPMELLPIWLYNESVFTGGYSGHPNQLGHEMLANVVLGYVAGGNWINPQNTLFLDANTVGSESSISADTLNNYNLHMFSQLPDWIGSSDKYTTIMRYDQPKDTLEFTDGKWFFTCNFIAHISRIPSKTQSIGICFPMGVYGIGLSNPGLVPTFESGSVMLFNSATNETPLVVQGQLQCNNRIAQPLLRAGAATSTQYGIYVFTPPFSATLQADTMIINARFSV